MEKAFNILSLICLFFIFSCSEENVGKESHKLLGEWKLVKMEYWGIEDESQGFEKFSEDLSNYGIAYTFLPDSILKVESGTHPTMEDRVQKYEFGYFPLAGSNDPEILLLKIDGNKFTYSFDGRTMILGKSYVDGADLHFRKR